MGGPYRGNRYTGAYRRLPPYKALKEGPQPVFYPMPAPFDKPIVVGCFVGKNMEGIYCGALVRIKPLSLA